MSLHISSHSKLPRPRESSFSGPDLKLFVKDVADKHGRKRAITVKTWSTVKDVKDVVNTLLHVPPSNQRLFFGPLMTSGYDLPNHRTLNDVGIYRSGETLFLEMKGNLSSLNSRLSDMTTLTSSGSNDICVALSVLNVTPKHLRKVVQQARRGLALGLKPDLVLDGSGGTYFMHDPKKVRVAVFKPADEEPYADNNPRGYIRQGPQSSSSQSGTVDEGNDYCMSLREGIKPGEACLREVAAYLLDHGSFSDVPMTTLVEARHPAFNHNGSMLKLSQGGAAVGNHRLNQLSSPQQKQVLEKKVGSFQCYAHAECSMDDLSPSKLSIDEVHKIAILDIRIMNADRNSANLLCRRNREDPDTFELIPIDHGFCLRTVSDICWFDWCWLDWPQMKEPLSTKTKNYILNLDIETDVRMLKESLQIPQEALDIFIASSKLLIEGVRAGLSLYDIAILCCRNDDAGELPSKLETFMTMAEDVALSAVDNGRWHHAAASRALAQKLSTENNNNARMVRSEKFSPMSIFKSASSANFSSFSSEASNKPPTPMAQSSGSDSSSDAGDGGGDEEECEQWAAAIIADKLETSDAPRLSVSPSWRGRQRAISLSSSTDENEDSSHDGSSCSSSSTPAGFWCVPPSSPKREIDHDISWSPHISPATTPNLLSSFGFDSERDKLTSKGHESKVRESVVKFNTSTFLIPPAALAPKVKPIEEALSEEIDHKFPMINISVPSLPIKRSQSYSAFSSDLALANSSDNATARNKSTNTSTDQFRTYYHKFIDLLITRHMRQAQVQQSY